MEFKYKITKFDNENKTVVVSFEDGHWAELRLTNPLPANIEELETIIKRYTAPVEVIEAQTAPSADLSYIESLIDVERTADRFSLKAAAVPPAVQEIIAPTADMIPAPQQPDPIPVTVI